MKNYSSLVTFIVLLWVSLSAPLPVAGQQKNINTKERTPQKNAENRQRGKVFAEELWVTKPVLLPSEVAQVNEEAHKVMMAHHQQIQKEAKRLGGEAEREGVYAQIRRKILQPATGKFIPGAPHNFVPWLDQIQHKFDWRDPRLEKRVVTPVRDQGDCQTCWAFAAVAALESNYKIKYSTTQYTVKDQTGNTVDEPNHGIINFSEQALINALSKGKKCSAQDNQAGAAFNFMVKTGLPFERTQQNSEYTGNPAEFDTTRELHRALAWGYVFPNPNLTPTTKEDIQTMKEALLDYGPLVAMVRSDEALRTYKKGIFEKSAEGDPNHWVLIIGWDETVKGKPAWIIKNSQGTQWGENGFMRIKMGTSSIGMVAMWIQAPLDFAKQDQ